MIVMQKDHVPLVTVIILNFNGWEDTIECLESLLQIDYQNYNVMVLDNGSTNSSISNINEYIFKNVLIEPNYIDIDTEDNNVSFPVNSYGDIHSDTESIKKIQVFLLKSNKNLGFTGGNNRCVKISIDNIEPEYILLLNNDTVVERNLIKELLITANNNQKTQVVQPTILNYYDKQINNRGFYLDIFGCPSPVRENAVRNEDSFFYASGACLLIKRELLQTMELSLFDNELFAYHEDVDLSWQARLMGFNIEICENTVCHHKEGKTSGKFNDRTVFWGQRNRLRVLLKNYSAISVCYLLPLTIILELSTSILTSIAKREPKFFLSSMKAIYWNIQCLSDTLEKRKKIQRSRRVSERELIGQLSWTSFDILSIIHSILTSR